MNSNDEKTQLIGRFIYILMNRVIALLNRHKFPKNICPYCGNVMISVVRTKNGESLRCPQCQGTFLRQYKPYLFIKRCSDHTNEMHCSYCGTKFESVWLNEKSEGYYCLHCKAYFSRPF